MPEPANATVRFTTPAGQTQPPKTGPFEGEVKLDGKKPLTVTIEHPHYFPSTITLYTTNTIPAKGVPVWTTNVALARREYRATIEVRCHGITPEGTNVLEAAQVRIKDDQETSGRSREVAWRRTDPERDDWSSVTIVAEAVNHQAVTNLLTKDQIPANILQQLDTGEQSREAWGVDLGLLELSREVEVVFETNEEGISVLERTPADSWEEAGKTGPKEADGLFRLRHRFLFKREPNRAEKYLEKEIRLQKADFEIQEAADRTPSADHRTKVTAQDHQRKIRVTNFAVAAYVTSPVLWWNLQGTNVAIVRSNAFSATKPPPLAVSELAVNFEAGARLPAGRLSAVPGRPMSVCLSLPFIEERRDSDQLAVPQANVVVLVPGAALEVKHSTRALAGLAVTPFVAENKTLYFSGAFDGVRKIMAKSLDEVDAGAQNIDFSNSGQYIDTEPAVFGSQSAATIAFTRRPARRVADSTPMIIVGTLPGQSYSQVGYGENPSWNSKGDQLVCVDEEHRVTTMAYNGAGRFPVTQKPEFALNPIWSPNDKYVIYVRFSSPAESRWQADIRRIKPNGADPQALVEDGSFNGFPVVSSDKRTLFFLTNRGAREGGKDNLRLVSLPLPPALCDP